MGDLLRKHHTTSSIFVEEASCSCSILPHHQHIAYSLPQSLPVYSSRQHTLYGSDSSIHQKALSRQPLVISKAASVGHELDLRDQQYRISVIWIQILLGGFRCGVRYLASCVGGWP